MTEKELRAEVQDTIEHLMVNTIEHLMVTKKPTTVTGLQTTVESTTQHILQAFKKYTEAVIGEDEGIELRRDNLKPKKNQDNRERRIRDKLRASQRTTLQQLTKENTKNE